MPRPLSDLQGEREIPGGHAAALSAASGRNPGDHEWHRPPTRRSRLVPGSAGGDTRCVRSTAFAIFAEPYTNHRIHCRFNKARTDPFTMAVALAKIRNEATVALDARLELLHRFQKLPCHVMALI
jgi:hypothetical protein